MSVAQVTHFLGALLATFFLFVKEIICKACHACHIIILMVDKCHISCQQVKGNMMLGCNKLCFPFKV